MTLVPLVAVFAFGWALWTFGEYALHRFAMHELYGKGILSREHLEHHVSSSWAFDVLMLASWAGMLVVGFGVWTPLAWLLFGPAVGIAVGVGWAVGYWYYEYQHAKAHLLPPRTGYGRRMRMHHFHHHFGHPMANHGVTIPLWDVVFGTRETPEQVRVPRRLALPWLVDEQGVQLRPEFAGDYVLVGAADSSERLAKLDRARAFASIAPAD